MMTTFWCSERTKQRARKMRHAAVQSRVEGVECVRGAASGEGVNPLELGIEGGFENGDPTCFHPKADRCGGPGALEGLRNCIDNRKGEVFRGMVAVLEMLAGGTNLLRGDL